MPPLISNDQKENIICNMDDVRGDMTCLRHQITELICVVCLGSRISHGARNYMYIHLSYCFFKGKIHFVLPLIAIIISMRSILM